MPYLKDYKRSGVRQIRSGPGPRPSSILSLMGVGGCGMGGFSDTDQCSTIPLGDPYRKPGNYCATPDGGLTTFNADGSTFRTPGAVDPDPAHPPGATASSSSSGGIWDTVGRIFGAATTPGVPAAVAPVQSGMSPTTMILLAGGALALVVLIARK